MTETVLYGFVERCPAYTHAIVLFQDLSWSYKEIDGSGIWDLFVVVLGGDDQP